ncbi:MAG: TIGR01212 family radical SAM protein [Candidatus Marinimicrobia bacterium]|nr:TIGR01212 family radical SAM protein [Candidatus Neomarinimicrobiota bacterium]
MTANSTTDAGNQAKIWLNRRYHNYNYYLQNLYGEKIRKVSLHGGFTCPNRDGSKGHGGCIYCNNDSFVPQYINKEMSIPLQMEASIPFMIDRYDVQKYIAYFQAYSNTYDELEKLKSMYEEAINYPNVVGLDIGTRSDCIDEPLLEYLAKLNERVHVTLEYGIESIHDNSLAWMNRGHDYESVIKAVELTKQYGIKVAGHIILGFPIETKEMMLETGLAANNLELDFLKIHQLHVVKGTVLAKRFREKAFPLFQADEYIELVADILERLSSKIVIQRLFGDAPEDILIAPKWGYNIPKLTHLMDLELSQRDTWQGRLYDILYHK